MKLAWRRRGGLLFLEAVGAQDAVLCVSTRGGGVSTGPYGTLNLGLHVGDEPGLVLENRRRLARALGFSAELMTCAAQVHGTDIAIVGAAEAGRGAQSQEGLWEVDGLVTAQRGVPLVCFYADCVPLLYYCQAPRVCAVAHAGWRGTLEGIAARMLRVLEGQFGCDLDRIQVIIGPAIGACCYTVGEEVRRLFAEKFGRPVDSTLDLQGINRQILVDYGLPSGNILVSGLCTKCHGDLFFSHRGAQQQGYSATGRHGAVVMLR